MTALDAASQRQGFWLALASAAGFGTNAISAQIASQSGLSGTLIVFYRVFVMLALVAAFVAVMRATLAVAKGQRAPVLIFGLASAIVGSAYLSSVAFLPITVAVVIFYTYPVLVVLAEPFVTGRRLSLERFAVALLAFFGVALVIGPDWHGLDWRGVALALAASVAAACQFFAGVASGPTSTSAKLFWTHVIVLPATAAILLGFGGFRPPQDLAIAPWAVAITIGGFVVAFILQVAALARTTPGGAALAFCAEPVFAALFAAIVLGERFGLVQYAGGVLVIGAIIANVTLEQQRARRLQNASHDSRPATP